MNDIRFGSALLAGVSLVAFAGPVHAQATAGDTTGAPLTSSTAQVEAAQTPPSRSEDIVVTGSRTIRNGNDSPSPVTVVQTADVLQLQPGTLADALNILPVFSGSHGTTYNPSSTGAVTAGNGNANQLNLRNLGPTRTLILIDGYRVPPTTFNNVVDVDVIPQMLISRVDTVTGGVSAVYGSDAVAGVVNYIIDRKFNGLKIDANSGISQRGDNQKISLGIAAGASLFGGRGHVEASYQYLDNQGIPARSDRPYLDSIGFSGSVVGSTKTAGDPANPYQLYHNLRQAGFPFGGLIACGTVVAGVNNCPLNNQTFATDGALRAFQAGQLTGTAALQVGGDGGYYDSTLAGKLRAHQVFGRFDFDVTDNIRFFAQASGDIKLNQNYSDSLRLSGVTLFAANAFLPAQYQAQLAGAGLTTFRLSELGGNNTRLDTRSHSNQFIFSGGFEGSFGKDWHWGADYSRGRSILDDDLGNNFNMQKVYAALDAVKDASGNIVCNAAGTVAPGCVPLNLFGPTAASQAALTYVADTTNYRARTIQDDFAAHVSGSPFSTWAGPLTVALSGEYRKLSFEATSNARPDQTVNCTGLRNCTATASLYQFTFANTPPISQSVSEGAIEADIPLVKDVRFIENLSLNAAARYTHYNTSGNYWTWKIGGDWRISDMLRFRATRSRDIRAPTLYELFSPATATPVSNLDLLTNTSPSVLSYVNGNPALTAEIANTTTVGAIFRPVRQLTFTIDAYRIRIDNAITLVSGLTPSVQQLCYAGNSLFCLQTRNAAGVLQSWGGTYLNIAQNSTEGVDFEANFTSTLFDRPMSLRLLAAYQPHLKYVQQGTATFDQAGSGFGPTGVDPIAIWRITSFFRFQPVEHVSVDILERWRSAMTSNADPTQAVLNDYIEPFATTNLTLTFNTAMGGHQAQFSLNVSNLFDSDPPAGARLSNGSRAGLRDGFVFLDDVVGRAFNAGFRLKF